MGLFNTTLHSLASTGSWANSTMRAIVYEGVPFNMSVQDLPVPTMQSETDAIVRITMSSICGSDLHVYHGLTGGTPPWTMGHEAVGYIAEVGSAVSSLSVGDYVIISDAESPGRLELEPEVNNYFGFGFPGLDSGLQGVWHPSLQGERHN